MAEVIGTVASVAQLVQVSGALLVGGYSFLSATVRAPAEIRSLLAEVAAVNSILSQLQQIEEDNHLATRQSSIEALKSLGAFEECQISLKFVQSALGKCQGEAGKDLFNLGRRLKWPFQEKETKEALQRLHRLRSMLMNAVELDAVKTLHRVETAQSRIAEDVRDLSTQVQDAMTSRRKEAVLAWLCPQSTVGQHNSFETAISRRAPGTGLWLWQNDGFQQWMTIPSSCLWLTGLPGTGKTILCAAAIQRIRKEAQYACVLYFFCDHGDPSKRTHESFIVSLVRQMFETTPELLQQAEILYNEKSNNGERPFNRAEYVPLLCTFLGHFDRIYLFCDALDEASDGSEIAQTLEEMLQYAIAQNVDLHLLFTSRFDIQFEQRHSRITENSIKLAGNMRADIAQYVHKELEARLEKGTLKVRGKELGITIQNQISSRAGTILQARLQLDFLLSAKSDKDLKSMLATLPYGLEHTYTTLLLHIAARYPHRLDDARKLLRCLTIASPTLTAANLAELLIMKPGEHFIDFEAVATDPYDILDVIAPFLTMTRSKGPNTIVKLCHFSLDEFLTSSRILQGEAHQFHVDSSDGNAWMAAICLQYLTLDIFGDTRQDTDVHRKSSEADYTFRRYAALNWSRHYKAGSKNVDAETRCGPYLRRLLSNEGDLSWYHNWQKVYHESYPWDESHLYSPICFAISQGMDNIVRELVSHQKDINQRFDDGYTCLAIAAKWDRVDLVRYLISIGADLEITAAKGCTPLHLATEFACYKSVLALLEAGANPHARSSSKSTPFYRACRGGDVRIVRKLKELGCDINAKTHDSWTPIMEAAEQNNEDVLDLLFEWGADLTTGRIKAGLNWDLQTKKNNSIARRTVV